MRNSLILIGLVLRTFSTVEATSRPWPVGFRHSARPVRSPLNARAPDVTVKVVLTLSPGATEVNRGLPGGLAFHIHGVDTLSATSAALVPVVFVYVSVTSCRSPGANVRRPGVRVSGCTA